MELSDSRIREAFREADDFYTRRLACGVATLYIYAIDGLTSGGDISEYVIKPIREQLSEATMEQLYENAISGGVFNSVAKPCMDIDTAVDCLVNGFCLVLFPGVGAIAFETKTAEKRSISPPDLENTAKGAKDAFTETVRTNTSLIRRHLRSPLLKISETRIGTTNRTNVAVLWMDGITPPEYVSKLKQRLESMEADGILSPSAAEEFITGSRFTAFPLLQYTERTDRFSQGLIGGRVGVIVDGIPIGYLLPVDIGYLMNSQEDVSRDFISANAIRILRYLALLFDLLMPALYIALTMYHWNLLPTDLAQTIARGREGVPFSPAWEIVMLLIAFELLQESGIHLPQNIGQSVSIIGGIVVGTAGVEAGLISSMALITVSIAGVCGFVLPNRDLADAVRVWRFVMVILAALLGLPGIGIGVVLLILRLSALKSLGKPYLRLFEYGLLRRRHSKIQNRERKKDKKGEKSP